LGLKTLTKTDAASVHSILDEHQALGLHVDHRLRHEIDEPGDMFLGTIDREDEFLRLVWQSNEDTRLLTPLGKPRTLFDCASRLLTFGWQFQRLVQAGWNWFRPCVDIDTAFDYGKVGLVGLTPLVESEKRETVAGNYYIYDGVHKSIVLAKRLLRRETGYSPVQVLLLTPRRE
jgi:hypothetical protein